MTLYRQYKIKIEVYIKIHIHETIFLKKTGFMIIFTILIIMCHLNCPL